MSKNKIVSVVNITKVYRGGKSNNNIVIITDSLDDVESDVMEWADSDAGGMNYGYEAEWDYVPEDSIVYKEALIEYKESQMYKIDSIKNKINLIEDKINSLDV